MANNFDEAIRLDSTSLDTARYYNLDSDYILAWASFRKKHCRFEIKM
ncbi:hypothetical protein DSUL_60195 [Desulfovibrionales bacterium]